MPFNIQVVLALYRTLAYICIRRPKENLILSPSSRNVFSRVAASKEKYYISHPLPLNLFVLGSHPCCCRCLQRLLSFMQKRRKKSTQVNKIIRKVNIISEEKSINFLPFHNPYGALGVCMNSEFYMKSNRLVISRKCLSTIKEVFSLVNRCCAYKTVKIC